MYNYGSEARELEYGEELEEQRRQEEAAARKAARLENKRRKKAVKWLAIVAVMLGIVMAREAQISGLCGQINTKKSEMENLEAVVTEKEMALSGALDLNMIEEAATTRLGMKKPDQSQYVYIEIEDENSGTVLAETKETGIGALIEAIKNLLSYLC
ncbi:MAG: hypothetical protein LUG52_07825 [Clostridia bacterium]|nr:hypothetical protein [Clostridia bacterium]